MSFIDDLLEEDKKKKGLKPSQIAAEKNKGSSIDQLLKTGTFEGYKPNTDLYKKEEKTNVGVVETKAPEKKKSLFENIKTKVGEIASSLSGKKKIEEQLNKPAAVEAPQIDTNQVQIKPDTDSKIYNLAAQKSPIESAKTTGIQSKGYLDKDAWGNINPLPLGDIAPSLIAGTGDLITSAGNFAKWKGNDGLAKKLIDKGGELKEFAPKTPEFEDGIDWKDFANPRLYTTLMARSSTFTLAMMPLALAAGATTGTIAGAVGIGLFGKWILSSIGSGVISSYVEANTEAANVYDEVFTKTGDREKANKAAQKTFNGNIVGLSVSNSVQYALLLKQFKAMNDVAKGVKVVKEVSKAGKVVKGVGTAALQFQTEGQEEVYQKKIAQNAKGEKFDLTKEDAVEYVMGGLQGLVFDVGGRIINTTTGKDVTTQITENGIERSKQVLEEIKTRVVDEVPGVKENINEKMNKGLDFETARDEVLNTLSDDNQKQVQEISREILIEKTKEDGEVVKQNDIQPLPPKTEQKQNEKSPTLPQEKQVTSPEAPETIKKEDVVVEKVKKKDSTEELEKMDYDPSKLELNVYNPNTNANPSDKYQLQVRYKGFAADKIDFDTKAEADKAMANYQFKGMTTNVAEDYAGSRFFGETYFKNTKTKEKSTKIDNKYEVDSDGKLINQNVQSQISPESVSQPTELILSPSKVVKAKDIMKEAVSTGMYERGGVKPVLLGKYEKPKIGKTELKTLLTNEEFRNNPVLTVTEELENGEKILEFKGKKLEFKLDTRGLAVNGSKLKIGDKITVDIKGLKEGVGVQQTRIFKNDKVYAERGGFSDVQSRLKQLKQIKALEFPEILRMYKSLTGRVPILKALRSYLGYAKGEKIVLDRSIFKDPVIASKVFAHEFGHLADFLGKDKTMARGNILGRIGSLRRYLKKLLPETPTSKSEILTQKDRDRLKKEAIRLSQETVQEEKEIVIGEQKATPEEILQIWNDTMASEKMPELMEYIKLLGEKEKVEIVKGAIKGVLPDWANFSILTKEKRLVDVVKNSPEDIKAKYKELLKEEITKRGLFNAEEIKNELKNLTQLWKPFNESNDAKYTKYRYSSPELYADAISVLFNDPDLLAQEAPIFNRAFFNWMDNKSEVRDVYMDIQEILNKSDEEIYKQRMEDISNDYRTGEEKQKAMREDKNASKTSIIDMLKTAFITEKWVQIKRYKKFIKQGNIIDPKFNPIYDLSGLEYMDGPIKDFLAKNFQPITAITSKVSDGWVKLGTILQLERAMTERSTIANPLGYDKNTAKWTLDKMEKETSKEEWAELQKAKELFRNGVNNFNEYVESQGFYTPELIQKIKENENYSAFQVLDYLDQKISPIVFEQKGTLKGIANPATSTVEKIVNTMRAIRINNSKKIQLNFLETIGEPAQPAKIAFNGKRQVPVEPRDKKNLTLIKVIEDGKVKGYYVDKATGRLLSRTPEPTVEMLSKLSKKFTGSAFFRKIFTQFKIGFQLFNIKKDFNRTWLNMPDKNLAEVVTSYFKLLGSYAKSIGQASKKARSIQTDLVSEMEKLEIFGANRNDLFGTDDVEMDTMNNLLKDYGLNSEKKGVFGLKSALTWFDRATQLLGNTAEALPKIAGYKVLKGKGMSDTEIANYVRNYIGSPDFLNRGSATGITNNIFLFSNAAKEGMVGDYQMATGQNKGMWWTKQVIHTLLPKLLLIAMVEGLFGDELKKILKKASEYDKTNYDIIPVGIDENGKAIYIRIPKNETSRLLGALTWKSYKLLSAEDKQSFLKDLSDVFSLGAGQIPVGLVPSWKVLGAWADYLSGNNPYDSFRSRNVIPDTEFSAGTKWSLPILLKWTLKQQGFDFVSPSFTPKANASKLEKIVNMPILSDIIGRFVKVSDYGEQELADKINKEEIAGNSQDTLRRREAIDEAIKNGTSIDFEKALGHPIQSAADAVVVKSLLKQMEIEKQKGKNVFVTNLIYAASNDAKAKMLKEYQNSMDSKEFSDILTTSLQYKIITSDVIEKFSKLPIEEEKKGLLNFDINLVKKAYAAEGISNLKNKLTWSKDERSDFEKFIDNAGKKIFGEQEWTKPKEGISADKLADWQKKMYENTMQRLREEDPQWYYDNLGEKVEKRILGKRMDSISDWRASEDYKLNYPTLTPTEKPFPTGAAREGVGEPVKDDVTYKGLRQRKPDEKIDPIIKESTKDSEITPTIISSLLWTESGYKPDAKNENIKNGKVTSTDRGIAQINDIAHPKVTKEQANDPKFAIPYAIGEIKKSLTKFDGDWNKTIVSYNRGRGRVSRNGYLNDDLGLTYLYKVVKNMDSDTRKELNIHKFSKDEMNRIQNILDKKKLYGDLEILD